MFISSSLVYYCYIFFVQCCNCINKCYFDTFSGNSTYAFNSDITRNRPVILISWVPLLTLGTNYSVIVLFEQITSCWLQYIFHFFSFSSYQEVCSFTVFVYVNSVGCVAQDFFQASFKVSQQCCWRIIFVNFSANVETLARFRHCGSCHASQYSCRKNRKYQLFIHVLPLQILIGFFCI